MRSFLTTKSDCRRKILNDHFQIKHCKEDKVFEMEVCEPKGCKCCDICREKCKCGECVKLPWYNVDEDKSEGSDKDQDEDEASEVTDKVEILWSNLQDYKEYMFGELGVEDFQGVSLSDFFDAVIERVLISSSFLLSVDDVMLETAIADERIANDLLVMIKEVFGSCEE